MTPAEQKKAAKEFAKRWRRMLDAIPAGRTNEEQDTQKFWNDLLENVLGVPGTTLPSYVDYERRVHGRRIDVFVEDHHFLCEQKSAGIDLDKPETRRNRPETPLQQALWYAEKLPYSAQPRWIMTCNFETFRIYDRDQEDLEGSMVEFSLADLPNSLGLLSFLTSDKTSRLHKEQELSVAAGKYVTKIYDALAACYNHIDSDDEQAHEEQRSLNVIITRIIFLLYAEDADLLQRHQAFGEYCQADKGHLRDRLIRLFEAVDTPENERDEYLDPEIAAFPYINGGLFHDRSIVIPRLSEEVADRIAEASEDFDWKDISGVIFGGVFEGTLNPDTRRKGGMHYTSVKNIDRCLDPLFLNELRRELAAAEGERVAAKRKDRLSRLHDRLASITVADPAMGSGNFLTESYRQLRTLENRIIEDEASESERNGAAGQTLLYMQQENPIRVTIDHFYGIEINDFAVAVAKTALWITEEQMLRKTQEIMPNYDFDFLPLRSLTNLREGNALTTDWNSVFPDSLDYLVGNPPFVGARLQDPTQKADLMAVYDGARNAGNIDYCAGWYLKAARFSLYKHTRCCLVSTNSICQGEQVANIWKPIHDLGIHIDFAHDTFRWGNEAAAGDQAHVFCVIVGFSREQAVKELYHHSDPDAEEVRIFPRNINFYLKDAPDVFIWDRTAPLCSVPKMGIGNKPIDGGNYLFTDEEKADFLKKEPGAQKYFRPWIGAKEFIHGYHRWCLWLGDTSWSDLKDLPLCRERIEAVRKLRLESRSAGTRKLAEKPTRFHVENMPSGNSILIPSASSQRRRYIPMGFIDPETICSNLVLLVPNATLYHFGILQSQFHNAWMRTVAGRLKADYRYSAGIVYNNFVWPDCGESAKEKVREAAQGVLDARKLYSDATMADLYDPDNETYFPELVRAHKQLDAAVEAAYGVDFKGDEEKIVSYLFRRYAEITRGK